MLDEMLRSNDLHRATPLENLDVLLHTTGGDPTAAYRMAQIIRDYAKHVTFIVPEYAYSAGTLLCLSSNSILLGDHAVLSPIDITLVIEGQGPEDNEDDRFPDESTSGEVETVAIDYFIQVAKQARIELESAFRQRGWKSSRTDVENALLTEMTKQLGVLAIATYYREKNLTQEYAEVLLRYMFGASRLSATKTKKILRELIAEAPSHNFPMDYHICESIGLKVYEMAEALSDASREITKNLTRLVYAQEICRPIHGIRFPHFEYWEFDPSVPVTEDEDQEQEAVEVTQNETKNSNKQSKQPTNGAIAKQ